MPSTSPPRTAMAISMAEGHELGRHALAHGEADDTSGAEVEDVGQVEPAVLGRDIGDVPAGTQPGFPDREIPADEVGSGGAVTSGMVVRTFLRRPSFA